MDDAKENALAIFDLVVKCFQRCNCLNHVTLVQAKWILKESIRAAHELNKSREDELLIVDDD